jgi:peptidoglycan/xylan/chitin deacetylase (PgdA/CDA1 family)
MSPHSQGLGSFPYEGENDGGRPVVALTFDDGPNEPYTSQIVDLLGNRGISGTFFQVGRCVQRHPGLSRALVEAGHVVGNHSYSHAFTRGWTEDALRAEVGEAEEILTGALGQRPLLYRPPWLIRTRALYRVLAEHGLQPVSGEFCHPLEPLQPAPERIARWAAARSRPGRILIFHDGFDDKGGYRGNTVGAVARLLDTLQERNYDFVTVDRLLGVPAYES